jgi:predicted nucleotidyltransferase
MDTASLLKLLNEYNVKYIIIGAAAFPIHGYARATLDIDIFIKPTPENVRRTISALKAFGYDINDVSEDDMLSKKILIRQYIVETDIHPFVTGITFEEVWNNKVEAEIYGQTANFACLDDLIKMKKAAGRAKDKTDLETLLELKSRKNSNL